VAAEVHLVGRRHPADLVLPAAPHEIGCLGEVVLGGDLLQELVGKPAREEDDGRGVPREGPWRERIAR
jgi:hypothetical protein